MPPSRSEVIDNFFTTTWRNVKEKVVDQIYKITPLWNTLLQGGKVQVRETGGRFIDIPIRYDKHTENTKWFSRGDKFGSAESEFLTQITYEMRYLGTSIVRFWEDDQKNRGPAKLLDYVQEKIDNAQATLVDTLETSAFTTQPGGKAISSLDDLIADDPTTGTVATLSRATYTWLRNQTRNGSGFSATDLLPEMTTMMNNCSKYKAGARRWPDAIFTTQQAYEDFEEQARAIHQIVASTSINASLGFGNLAFKGVPLYWSPECPDGRMLFLNTEHMKFIVDTYANFDMGPWKEDIDSRDRKTQIFTCCQLCFDNFQKQGVIHSIPAL